MIDRSAVGIAHVDNPFPGVWSRDQGLRVDRRLSIRGGNCRSTA